MTEREKLVRRVIDGLLALIVLGLAFLSLFFEGDLTFERLKLAAPQILVGLFLAYLAIRGKPW